MTEMTQDVPQESAGPEGAIVPAQALWAERTGERSYTGRNSRGAEVLIGNGDGQFTPGELLQIALATCSTLSAEHRLARALGDDFTAVAGVSVEKNDAENRYEHFTVEIVTDLSALAQEELTKTLERAEAAIERHCTVGRTLDAGAGHSIVFTDEPA